MPPVRSVTIAPDTFTITTKRGVFTLNRGNLSPAILAQATSSLEATVNTLITSSTAIQDMAVRIHITQVSPQLIWTVGCFNPDVVIPPTWWL